MKAITLWEPWASCIARGYKTIETRSWGTYHRGPLLIHAAKRPPRAAGLHRVNVALTQWGYTPIQRPFALGCVVAACRLADCRAIPYGLLTPPGIVVTALEMALGDYRYGRYCWVLEDVVPILPPVPCPGHQGLWTAPPELVALVRGAVPIGGAS